jgi:hypothetical protein
MCPQKLNTFSLTTFWNPLIKDNDTIMAATLRVVAAMDNLIMKRENDCSLLKAMRLAMKNGRFRTMVFVNL